jgi:hypothetical protein
MAYPVEEKELFDKLIRVLEDALEAAAKVLGPNTGSSYLRRHDRVDHAYQIYDYLSSLLDEARVGRSNLR